MKNKKDKQKKRPCNLTLSEDVKELAKAIAKKNDLTITIVSGVEYAVRQEARKKKYKDDK